MRGGPLFYPGASPSLDPRFLCALLLVLGDTGAVVVRPCKPALKRMGLRVPSQAELQFQASLLSTVELGLRKQKTKGTPFPISGQEPWIRCICQVHWPMDVP